MGFKIFVGTLGNLENLEGSVENWVRNKIEQGFKFRSQELATAQSTVPYVLITVFMDEPTQGEIDV